MPSCEQAPQAIPYGRCGEVLTKRLKTLTKRLQRIDRAEESRCLGQKLERDQLEALERKAEVEAQKQEVESLLKQLCQVEMLSAEQHLTEVRRAGVDAILKMVELSAAVRHGLLDDETGDLEYTGGNTIKLPQGQVSQQMSNLCERLMPAMRDTESFGEYMSRVKEPVGKVCEHFLLSSKTMRPGGGKSGPAIPRQNLLTYAQMNDILGQRLLKARYHGLVTEGTGPPCASDALVDSVETSSKGEQEAAVSGRNEHGKGKAVNDEDRSLLLDTRAGKVDQAVEASCYGDADDAVEGVQGLAEMVKRKQPPAAQESNTEPPPPTGVVSHNNIDKEITLASSETTVTPSSPASTEPAEEPAASTKSGKSRRRKRGSGKTKVEPGKQQTASQAPPPTATQEGDANQKALGAREQETAEAGAGTGTGQKSQRRARGAKKGMVPGADAATTDTAAPAANHRQRRRRNKKSSEQPEVAAGPTATRTTASEGAVRDSTSTAAATDKPSVGTPADHSGAVTSKAGEETPKATTGSKGQAGAHANANDVGEKKKEKARGKATPACPPPEKRQAATESDPQQQEDGPRLSRRGESQESMSASAVVATSVGHADALLRQAMVVLQGRPAAERHVSVVSKFGAEHTAGGVDTGSRAAATTEGGGGSAKGDNHGAPIGPLRVVAVSYFDASGSISTVVVEVWRQQQFPEQLRKVLEDATIIKVTRALGGDREAMRRQLQLTMHPVRELTRMCRERGIHLRGRSPDVASMLNATLGLALAGMANPLKWNGDVTMDHLSQISHTTLATLLVYCELCTRPLAKAAKPLSSGREQTRTLVHASAPREEAVAKEKLPHRTPSRGGKHAAEGGTAVVPAEPLGARETQDVAEDAKKQGGGGGGGARRQRRARRSRRVESNKTAATLEAQA